MACPNAGDDSLGDGGDLAAGAELLQGSETRQFFLLSQVRAQGGIAGQCVEHAAEGGSHISTQNQAGHELSLGKIFAAGRGSMVGQMFSAQSCRQVGNLFNFRPAILLVDAEQSFKTQQLREKVLQGT